MTTIGSIEADATLRAAIKDGDSHDVRQALLGVLYSIWTPLNKLVMQRLGEWDAFYIEVVDRAVEEAYLAALAIAREELHNDAWMQKFLAGNISGFQLLVGYAGNRKRGLIWQIFTREAKRRAAAASGDEVFDKSGATRLSFVRPDVALERREEAERLNAALEHLKPNARFALALLYDVGGLQGVTDPTRPVQDRVRELRAVLPVFGFESAEVGKIARRFQERVRELDAHVLKIDDSDPRKKRTHDGVWTQRQIAALLDRPEGAISTLVSSARATLTSMIA